MQSQFFVQDECFDGNDQSSGDQNHSENAILEKCTFCDNHYTTKEELHSHIDSVHKFLCIDCNLGFETIEIFEKHAEAIHKGTFFSK